MSLLLSPSSKWMNKGREDNELVSAKLEALRQAAQRTDNLMPFILEAVRAYAILGEVCGVLRKVFGEYHLPALV